ncbi:MAG: Rrf2 family transcriptional regulator [Alphaproteobacteria bacterium]|nr:Rrf2 family transcriptional regulator [Alphaproteobacteria bacterium]
MSEGIEWAIHCCAVLAALPAGSSLSARDLAGFFDLPPDYLAKHLNALSAAGVINSKRGRSGGRRLARPPDAITLLDIVEAVDGAGSTFRCTQIRRRGPCARDGDAYPRPCGIARAMWRADSAWRAELKATTLAEIVRLGAAETPDAQRQRAVKWLGERLK